MSAPPTLKAIFGRRAENLRRFEGFHTGLRDLLAERAFDFGGQAVTLGEYLRRCEADGSPGGDEQSVVDHLMRRLLGVLGYQDGDLAQNRRLPGQRARSVPDFTVRVAEFLPRVAVFVVEDKATTVRDLSAPARVSGRDESPIQQLRRYACSGAVHARSGLLCNGWTLEGWSFGGDADTRVVMIDLHALSLEVDTTPAEPIADRWKSALLALWMRFSRRAFEDAAADLRESSAVPSLPVEEIKAINERFSATRRTAAIEQVLDGYLERVWREGALDIAESSEILVDALRALIDEFADDVRHQLDEALTRDEDVQRAVRQAEDKADVAAARQKLALLRHRFDRTEDQFAAQCLAPIDAWCAEPRPGGVTEIAARVCKDLGRHVRIVARKAGEQRTLLGVVEVVGARKGGEDADAAAQRSQALGALEQAIRDVCKSAAEARAARQALETEHRASLAAARAWSEWEPRVSSSVMVGATPEMLRAEFARQTAYVFVVRLLLVRICEDKGLFARKLSDGGLVRWQEDAARYLDYASGRSYEYVTRMAYECAQNVYAHFYGASGVFDWYRMDDKILLRALVVLNAFNLERIDTDIIGTVYGRYLKEGKHEQGRYYTARPLVRAILDRAGYVRGAIADKRIGDLACGSGSFLVEACRRLLDGFREADGTIPTSRVETALEEIRRSLYGIDLNPFACYLAETNLLIQVLDLVRQAKEAGVSIVVERFSIHCADSLLVSRDLADSPALARVLFPPDAVDAELIKARAGDFAGGFDFLVGNPPYVRADEGEGIVPYRRRVEDESWFETQHLKWDLYIPFVEQYLRLLADGPEARCCLVTIESLGTAPYAAKLRAKLTEQATVHDVLFTEKLKLFADAKWQDNIVFSFSRGAPPPGHVVEREIARGFTDDGSISAEPLDRMSHGEATADRIFNRRRQVSLDLAKTAPLEELCYVSKGMVLHANEKIATGEIVRVPAAYDPARFGEELVEDLGDQGKRIRHKPFSGDALVSARRDDLHGRPHVGSREVRRGGFGPCRWIEYGEAGRCPSRVDRPTFPELYDRAKLMIGAFTGAAVDEGKGDGFLVVSDMVRVAVRWCLLEDLRNRSLTESRKALGDRYDPKRSERVSEWYLCALVLSDPVQRWLHANRRSMKDHVYPEDIKAIPVKLLTPKQQQPFIDLAKERHHLWSEIIDLEERGFGKNGELPVWEVVKAFRKANPKLRFWRLVHAATSDVLKIDQPFWQTPLRGLRSHGDALLLKRETAGRLGAAVKTDREDVARVFARLLSALPATYLERENIDEVPATTEGLLALGRFLDEQAREVAARYARIEEIDAAIDRRAWRLYRPTVAGAGSEEEED
ncbi:MAG: N-6 DNA methylase [Polyangiaceae bacterium]|nr:N-6 DNA methylase [Polyangiaceae bacterium]